MHGGLSDHKNMHAAIMKQIMTFVDVPLGTVMGMVSQLAVQVMDFELALLVLLGGEDTGWTLSMASASATRP